MAKDFPRTAGEITNEWLSGVLGGTVTGYETTFLEGGVLSDAFKLHGITYAGGAGTEPSSVVVKVANGVKERRDSALAVNAYVKELNFFRDLAKDVPIASPKVYACLSDGSEGRELHHRDGGPVPIQVFDRGRPTRPSRARSRRAAKLREVLES
jgi:hypothetical protein